jgi:hypothetical protein
MKFHSLSRIVKKLRARSLPDMTMSKGEKCSRAIMLSLGMSCFISGVYYASQSYTDTRAMLISQYAAAVQSFSSDNLPFFSALDIVVLCDKPSLLEHLVKQEQQVTGVCRGLKCDMRSDLPSYTSIVYVLANISRDLNSCQLAITPSIIPAPPLQSLLPLPSAVLKKQIDAHLNSKMCNNRGGTYRDGSCWVQGWLKSGCATISGTVMTNLSLGGVVPVGASCDLLSSTKADDIWDYTEYHPPSVNPTLTLRSFKDPYMIAQVITEGTLDFGSTPKDNFNTGVVLLSLGIALFLPQICMCAFRLRSWLQDRHRRRYHANLERAADVDSPSQSPASSSSSSISNSNVGGLRRQVGRTRGSSSEHEMQPVHDAAVGGTIVDMSRASVNLGRPSPRLKATIVDVAPSANV